MIRYIVKITLRIGGDIIDGRGNKTLVNGESTDRRFYGACGSHSVADHRLDRADWYVESMLLEHLLDSVGFDPVIGCGARAVGADVINLVYPDSRFS